MFSFLQPILDWSEVWALLLPLVILSFTSRQPRFFTPVIIYLWLALLLDILIDVSWKLRACMPPLLYPNNYMYNIHSVIRFICFSSFFMLLQIYRPEVMKLISLASLLFILVDFLFFENFFNPNTFSSRLFALESGILLFYCLQYFLTRAQAEDSMRQGQPEYWVVVGLSIYVVFNFFLFLFYTTLAHSGYGTFLAFMWNFHNITFILLCIFIAKAFYAAGHH